MPLSIIIPTHNQASELREHLPAILDQDFTDFEVIVVDMSSMDETKDVLEDLELRYPALRHTRTPASARDISIERLAITLGFRTAKHEWVVITRADCHPATSHWLQALSQQMQEGKDIVIGVAKYSEEPHSWLQLKAGFFRQWNSLANIYHIRSGHAAVRADGCNLAMRRSFFLSKDGFGDHLNLLAGAEELLVNHLSTPRNTAIAATPEAIVIQDPLPLPQLWKKQRVFYMETRRHQNHTATYRTHQNLRLLTPWLLLIIACAIWPVLQHFYPQQQTAIAIITALILLLTLILTVFWVRSSNRAARAIGYQRNYNLTRILFTLQLPFWNFRAWLAHRLSPQTEFRKKFV